MRILHITLPFLIFMTSLFFSCQQQTPGIQTQSDAAPDDLDLYLTILNKDLEYFTAYNNCDMEKQAAMYTEDVEFYHDQGGLNTSKTEILQMIKENICGKVQRTLVEGSVEVYPIKGYGAVEVGYHTFFNNEEPDAPAKPSKFITIWRLEENQWKMARVVSLH